MSEVNARQFAAANSALRLKRQTFSWELTEFLQKATSTSSPSREVFLEEKVYFESLWEAVISATDNCLSVLSNDEDPDGKFPKA